jgi:hypothetical protein
VVVVDVPSGLTTVTVIVPSACVTFVSVVQVLPTHGSFTSTTVVVLSPVFVVVHELWPLPSCVQTLVVDPSAAVSVVVVVPSSKVVVQFCLLFAVVHVGPEVIWAPEVDGAAVVVQTPTPAVTLQ